MKANLNTKKVLRKVPERLKLLTLKFLSSRAKKNKAMKQFKALSRKLFSSIPYQRRIKTANFD